MLYKNFIKNQAPDIRHLFDIKEVILDQEWLSKQDNIELYYMYRGVGLTEEDKKKIADARLRYDITVIPPLMLGKEYNKTAGHYHCEATKGISYPEIYEVLEGEAYYLMQSVIENNSVEDVYFVYAAAGDKVIIPPNYGHFTINAGNKNLAMANWVCLDCVSDYSEVKEKRGACYYAVKYISNSFLESDKNENSLSALIQEENKIDWLENKNYQNVPKLKELSPTNFSEFGLEKNRGMYELVYNLEKLNFLINPGRYKGLWKRILG